MNLKFEWDRKKAASNLSKHGVSFEEERSLATPCPGYLNHSIEEQREIIIGHSAKDRSLVVCFTAQGESVRIFSARTATRRERKDYEENVKP